jgi:hypothetical protein
MKWNNRLKSVLTETTKSGFSEDSLETPLTITDKTPLKLVSSAFVSDEFRHFPENLSNSAEAEKQSNLVSSAFVSSHSRESFKNNDELADFKAGKFHEILNRFIESGIWFEVSADDFQTIDGAQILKASDKDFLEFNSAAILCQLQQSFLMKHLFNHAPEQFEDFAFEVREREAIYAADYLKKPVRITAETLAADFYFAAVSDVSKKWCGELLNQKENQ